MAVNYITDAVRAIIGAQSTWLEAPHPVEPSEVRRFFHATMDHNPSYWDPAAAAQSRYGAPVAPPGFPVHAFRRAASEDDDPLDRADDPDFDGVSRAMRPGLPNIPVPLPGVLNGGYQYEFFSNARVGERIRCRSAYRDIYQRQGKAGPIVFVVIEDEYETSEGRPLLKSLNTMIMR
jgi:acyl dehydratase